MAWEIKVWHDAVDGRTRLSIEAGEDVPEDVIAHLASVYWAEEVQGLPSEWEEGEPFEPPPSGRFQS